MPACLADLAAHLDSTQFEKTVRKHVRRALPYMSFGSEDEEQDAASYSAFAELQALIEVSLQAFCESQSLSAEEFAHMVDDARKASAERGEGSPPFVNVVLDLSEYNRFMDYCAGFTMTEDEEAEAEAEAEEDANGRTNEAFGIGTLRNKAWEDDEPAELRAGAFCDSSDED